jgi:putative intracellular protease/amidase
MVVVARASADQPQAKPAIRVAIYDDAGGGGAGPGNCERCLPSIKGFKTRRLSAQDIRDGQLDGFDVLVQPGGSGSKQAAALGPEGRQKIRDFVERGNGYIGICAGAYLASADYEWSLGLLDAKVLDRKHWARGNGDVEMRLTGNGQQALSAPSSVVTVYYGQGPLLAPAGKRNIPDYEELAVFETEIAENGASPGVMRGTTAAARGTFGKGRVFCFSPHPEKTAGLEPLVEAAIRWAAATGERPSN